MVLCGISTPFGVLFPCLGKVAHALLTRPPLKQSVASYQLSPLDLHVLGTPPAFVLSQDQTLSFNPLFPQSGSPDQVSLIRNYCLVCVVCSVSFSRFVPVALGAFQRLAQPALLVYYVFALSSTPFSHFFVVFSRLFLFPNSTFVSHHPSFGFSPTFHLVSFWFIRVVAAASRCRILWDSKQVFNQHQQKSPLPHRERSFFM